MTLVWSTPVDIEERDGSLTHYSVDCSSAEHIGYNILTEITSEETTLEGLQPYNSYNCCVAAVTTKGVSPNVCVQATTFEEGTLLL